MSTWQGQVNAHYNNLLNYMVKSGQGNTNISFHFNHWLFNSRDTFNDTIFYKITSCNFQKVVTSCVSISGASLYVALIVVVIVRTFLHEFTNYYFLFFCFQFLSTQISSFRIYLYTKRQFSSLFVLSLFRKISVQIVLQSTDIRYKVSVRKGIRELFIHTHDIITV